LRKQCLKNKRRINKKELELELNKRLVELKSLFQRREKQKFVILKIMTHQILVNNQILKDGYPSGKGLVIRRWLRNAVFT
jgi:hypothetical protein